MLCCKDKPKTETDPCNVVSCLRKGSIRTPAALSFPALPHFLQTLRPCISYNFLYRLSLNFLPENKVPRP
jgi:hypothetical protein